MDTEGLAKLRGVGPRCFQLPGIRAKANVVASSHDKPVKLVIPGTIVALTTWTVSANPHSDEGGKPLLAYLRAIAIKHEVTIVVVGHSNKGMRCAKSFSVMT